MSGFVVWFTGLSGSGKSTLGRMVSEELERRGLHAERLDGDEMRQHICKDLGFSRAGRDENVRRIGFVARIVERSGACAVVSAISPYASTREEVRRSLRTLVLVFTDCPVSILARRDTKGLYERALAGTLPAFTGVSDPYEAPERPDVHLHTGLESEAESLAKVLSHLEARGLIPGT